MAMPSQPRARPSRGVVISTATCLALLLALASARTAVVAAGPIDLLLRLAITCGVVWVCMADARLLGKPLPALIPMVMFFTWPLSIPVYLIWSRGWRRGGVRSVAYAIVLVLLLGVPHAIAGYLVHGAAFFETV